MGTLIFVAVLFWLLREVGAVVIFFVVAFLIGGLFTWIANEEIGVAVGVIVGWLAAAAWGIYAVVQVILQIISIVQMAAG